MAVAIQKELLRSLIQKMCDDGMVNSQFVELLELKNAIKPDFVLRAITLYCMAVKILFPLLTNLIDEYEVDFYQVAVHARDLFERSRSIGAEHVKLASADIVQSCRSYDKNRCTQALYQTKKKFAQLRKNLETIVQMERKIIDHENGTEAKILSLNGRK